jgi:hypothetical protein
MKILSLFLFLLASALSSVAQFGKINVQTGVVNVHSSTNTEDNNIIDKLSKNVIVHLLELNEENWVLIEYVKKGIRQQGYLPRSVISSFSQSHPINGNLLDENTLEFRTDKLELKVKVTYFTFNNKKFEYRMPTEDAPTNKYISSINGVYAHGSSGKTPKNEYHSISGTYAGKAFSLPIKGYYEPNLSKTQLYYDEQTQTFYLVAENGNAKDPYTIVWEIKNGDCTASGVL